MLFQEQVKTIFFRSESCHYVYQAIGEGDLIAP